MAGILKSVLSLFRRSKNAGHHRRQRVVFVQALGYMREFIGNQLYYIGASMIRARRNFFRRIRHGLKRFFRWTGKGLSSIFRIIASWAKDLWADLSNPFIKGVRSAKGYRDMMAEIKEAPGRVKRGRARAFWHYGLKWNGHLIERFASHVMPALALVICVFVMKTVIELPYAIKVTAAGQDIGFIDSESVYDEAISTIKSRIIKVDDNNWEPSAILTISVADTGEINTQDVMANKILMASGMEVAEATGIYIGGQFYGATTAGHLLETTVDSIIAPYRKSAESMGSDVTVRFTRNVDLVNGIFPANSVVPYEELNALITSTEERPIYYSAKEGEKVETIAKNNGLTLSSLKSLNPSADLSDTYIHDNMDLMVSQKDSLLSVKTVRTIREYTSIGYRTINTVTSDYSLGYYRVTQYGSPGEKLTVTEVEYKNGNVVRSTVIEETVTKQPVDMYVVVGSGGSGGVNVYGGSLGWPTGPMQYVSQWFSSSHLGIDIACAYGVPIYAAESGIVSLSQDGYYTYGYTIIIDHGSGMQTLYAHMSQRVAQVGDYVNRGQLIGFIGSTGASTGPHLHFEVRVDGVRVNPQPYLYG